MRINREAALRALNVVSSGVSPTGIIEQSSCFVIRDGRIFTYNEEIACEIDSPFGDIEGAVHASTLIGILSKYPDEELDVSQSDSELIIKTKRKRSRIRCESEILMPVDLVEYPKKWRSLDPSFSEAINSVKDCVATDGEKFYITCIHITPEYVEACDNYQMARYVLPVPVKQPILVRQASLLPMLSFGMNQLGETKSWVHFKNDLGLIYSVRRHLEEYLVLDAYFDASGEPIMIPPGIDEAVGRAELFTAKNDVNAVIVKLSLNRLVVEGMGVYGKHEEMKQTTYDGEPLSFMIQPKVFAQLGNRAKSFHMAEGRIVVTSGPMSYASRISLMA